MAVGGLSLKVQEIAMRQRPDIVVATPGRMIDLVRNTNSISLEDIEVLILDEADRLLDMGFADEVKELVQMCPRGRQTLLFSATISSAVDSLVNMSLNNPADVKVDTLYNTADNLRQQFVRVKKAQDNFIGREATLLALITRNFEDKTIIFFRSKRVRTSWPTAAIEDVVAYSCNPDGEPLLQL